MKKAGFKKNFRKIVKKVSGRILMKKKVSEIFPYKPFVVGLIVFLCFGLLLFISYKSFIKGQFDGEIFLGPGEGAGFWEFFSSGFGFLLIILIIIIIFVTWFVANKRKR